LYAQNLTGLWYSSDSTRIYEIKETAVNKYTAVIKSSTRKADKPGYVVVNNLIYNPRRKRYEGIIYAVKDGEPAFVKIKFSKKDKNEIMLRLNRMFVFDVAIDWIRASA
jgi:hypothetical protein